MKLQLKRSNVLVDGSAKSPEASQLDFGELAINYSADDPVIFLKDSNNQVIRISGIGLPDLGNGSGQSGTLDDRYLMLSGGTMSGNITLFANPTAAMEAATKQYVDNQVGNIDVPSATEVGTVPPNNPIEGALWWDTNDGRLYVYYTDINSSQWVPAIPETVIATATVINSDDVEYYLTGVSAPFDGNDDQLNYSTSLSYNPSTNTITAPKFNGAIVNPGAYTTTARDGLTGLNAGDMIFNSSDSKLQIWNGTVWEAAGGASVSAPQIGNAVLSEQNTGGDRFTNEAFTVDITMLDDGAPVSQKGIKGKVSAEFNSYPSTAPITDNSVTYFPSGVSYQKVEENIASDGLAFKFPITGNQYNGYLSVYRSGGTSITGDVYFSTDPLADYYNDGLKVATIGSYGAPQGYVDRAFISGSGDDAYYCTGSYSDNWINIYLNESNVMTTTLMNSGVVIDPTDNQRYFKADENFVSRSSERSLGNRTVSGNYDTYISQYDHNTFIAVGNGKVLTCGRRQQSEDYRPFIAYIDTNFAQDATPSSYNFGAKLNRNIQGIWFKLGYFFVLDQKTLFRSSTGLEGSWTAIPLSGYQVKDIEVDPTDNSLYALALLDGNTSSGSASYLYRSTNFGSTWTQINTIPGFAANIPEHLFIRKNRVMVQQTGGSPKEIKVSVKNQQTLTLQSQGEQYDQFNVGDAIKPSGTDSYDDWGFITSISGTTIEVDSDHIYTAGESIEAVNPTGTAISTRFLVISTNGQVTSTQSIDPGFTELGPGLTQQISFPGTFPTGNTPDEELPVGTTLQVEVEATNSVASDTFSSNIITPA